jgi:hypothetical protein
MIDWINVNIPYPRLILVGLQVILRGTCGGNKWRLALVVRWVCWRSEHELWVHFRDRSKVGCWREKNCPGVFSILKYHFWITHAFHSSIVAEALAGRLAAQREPSNWVSASFAFERSKSWNIRRDVGQISLRWWRFRRPVWNLFLCWRCRPITILVGVYDSFLWKWLFDFLDLFGNDLHLFESFW